MTTYFVKDIARELGLSVPGVYKLRRVMASKGTVVGTPTGIRTGNGDILSYSEEDLEAMRQWRREHLPNVRIAEILQANGIST